MPVYFGYTVRYTISKKKQGHYADVIERGDTVANYKDGDANALLDNWICKWSEEEPTVQTHCSMCGKELSEWERENHMSVCQSCGDHITYGGSLGYHDSRT